MFAVASTGKKVGLQDPVMLSNFQSFQLAISHPGRSIKHSRDNPDATARGDHDLIQTPPVHPLLDTHLHSSQT